MFAPGPLQLLVKSSPLCHRLSPSLLQNPGLLVTPSLSLMLRRPSKSLRVPLVSSQASLPHLTGAGRHGAPASKTKDFTTHGTLSGRATHLSLFSLTQVSWKNTNRARWASLQNPKLREPRSFITGNKLAYLFSCGNYYIYYTRQ